MPRFLVGVKEVWEQMYSVEAENADEALKKVEDADDSIILLEDQFALSSVLEPEDWNVYEVKDN